MPDDLDIYIMPCLSSEFGTEPPSDSAVRAKPEQAAGFRDGSTDAQIGSPGPVAEAIEPGRLIYVPYVAETGAEMYLHNRSPLLTMPELFSSAAVLALL